MKVLTFFTLLLLASTTAFGAGPSDILGTWRTERDESKVEISRCGEKLCGKIVWLKNPKYTDSNDGQIGTPIIDRKNPDPALRSRPLIGLKIMDGFTKQGDNTWGKGICYDPKSGNAYQINEFQFFLIRCIPQSHIGKEIVQHQKASGKGLSAIDNACEIRTIS